MDVEDWIILAKFASLPEANEAASFLKEEGIPCHTIFAEPERPMFITASDHRPWIYLEVREADFEDAADILELEPIHMDDIDDFYDSKERKTYRRNGAIIWGGIFSGLIALKLLADFIG